MDDSKQQPSEKKQLTLEELSSVVGGARKGKVKAGGKGSINGEPTEFPVDEF
jgi:hypothetical protein